MSANPQIAINLLGIVVERLGEVIKDINSTGVSILLVEQNVRLALGVATKCYALQVGRVFLEGDTDKIKSSDIVKRAYLGG